MFITSYPILPLSTSEQLNEKKHREVLCSKFPKNTADLFRFTEEILNGKLDFLYSVISVIQKYSVEILADILQTH